MVNKLTPSEQDSSVEEFERELPSVSEGTQKKSKLGKAAVVGVMTAALGYCAWASFTAGEAGEPETEKQPVQLRATQTFEPAPEKQVVAPAEQPAKEEPAAIAISQEEKQQEQVDKMLEASRRAPVLAFNGGGSANDKRSQSSAAPIETVDGSAPAGFGGSGKALAAELQPTKLTGMKATRIANMHLTVPKGTHIPCTLETALSSDVPGLVSCIVARDVLGASGQVVLAEKGSKVFGEYQGGLKRGQRRIFVLWTELRTPEGVVVQLDSPATDALGRGGFGGKIDNKWPERFGGAILFSVLSDVTSYGFAQLASQDLEADTTESTSETAASVALQESINIPPTLYKNQGELVNVFVARDLDFSDVYQLRRTHSGAEIANDARYDNAVPRPSK